MALWNRLLNRLQLVYELSFSDWLALGEAWWVLLVYYWRLRLVSFERMAQPTYPDLTASGDHLSVARHLERLVRWASRLHPLRMTCLVQSLTLHGMLSRRGIASQIKIGAMKTQVGFHAHAWVEVDGEVIGDSEVGEGRFSTFISKV